MTKITVQDAFWNRFKKPIIYGAVISTVLFVGYLFPFKQTIQTESLLESARTAFENVVPDTIKGIEYSGTIPVTLLSLDNGIGLTATLSGEAFNQHNTSVTLVAISKPRVSGAGWGPIGRTVVTFWDSVTGNPATKRLRPNFTTFYIEPGSFTINDEPAIEFAVPGGQRVVEGAGNTKIGKTLTGGLTRLGFDTSDKARDAWTGDVMRKNEDLLIAWFSNIVRKEMNNQSIYTFGNNTTEQLFAASYGGVAVTPKILTLKLYLAPIFALIIFAI
jgi:hypothetical protein